MTQVNQLRCRNCDADIDISTAVDGVVTCEYCGSSFTVVREDTSDAARRYLHDGESALDTAEFDKAFTFYSKAIELAPDEPEGYFGRALSTFKVQHLKDTVRNCLQPICHKAAAAAFCESPDYIKALSLASPLQKSKYTEQALEIDHIRKEFFDLTRNGVKYDCFICVKVSDGNGRTDDYKYADDIYFELRGKGLNPFFSERELANVTGADYEARILYALMCSECMLIVCSHEEYLNTPWVKNEYTRFLKLVNDEVKESDSIAIVFNGTPIEHLPGKNGKIQGIDLSSLNALERIGTFVDSHTPLARKKRELEERQKQEHEKTVLKSIEEQKRAQSQLEEQLKNIANKQSASGGSGATTASLLTRAQQEMEFKNFNKATEYYNRVLDVDPQNGDAWYGLFLISFGVCDNNALIHKIQTSKRDAPSLLRNIKQNKNYITAKKFAIGETKNALEQTDATIYSFDFWWNILLNDLNAESWDDALRKLHIDNLDEIFDNAIFNFIGSDYTSDIQEYCLALEKKVNEIYAAEIENKTSDKQNIKKEKEEIEGNIRTLNSNISSKEYQKGKNGTEIQKSTGIIAAYVTGFIASLVFVIVSGCITGVDDIPGYNWGLWCMVNLAVIGIVPLILQVAIYAIPVALLVYLPIRSIIKAKNRSWNKCYEQYDRINSQLHNYDLRLAGLNENNEALGKDIEQLRISKKEYIDKIYKIKIEK